MKQELKGKKLIADDEVKMVVSMYFEDKERTVFKKTINKLMEKFEKYWEEKQFDFVFISTSYLLSPNSANIKMPPSSSS